jgi:hypothetical protein
MNCEQMMEWMQRFMDEDLPRAEQDILMKHIKQCPDCAVSFEQFQFLSAELSRLPTVSPPFSIVDSILPKLAEIDAQQASIQVAYLPEIIHHKKSLFSWRMGAGFVAAAIFFGLIAVNLSPSSNNDASELLKSAMGVKNSQKKSVQVQSSDSVAADQVNGANTETPQASAAPEAAPAASAVPKAGVFSEATDLAPKDRTTEADQKKSIAPKQPQISNKSTYTLTRPEPAASATPSTEVTTDSTNAKIAPALPTPTPAPLPDKGKSSIYSITTTEGSAAPSLASDDGNLIGFVERQIVEVRTPDGHLIYTSSVQWKSTDVIQLIKWENNAHLIYEVTMEDGQLKRFMIDPIQKTEQEH